MYNLIIVDDEKIIRRGLRNYIPWEELGFTVTEEFGDGKDAIPYLLTHEVDTVLTDIRMVNVSGLELAEYIVKNHPSVKTVILSGYKEFEYAQKAISCQVKDYLLKPINREDVVRTFRAIKNELDRERDASPGASPERSGSSQPLELRHELIAAVISGDREETARLLGEIPLMSREDIQYGCFHFFGALTTRLEELGMEDICGSSSYSDLYSLSSAEEVREWFCGRIGCIAEKLNRGKSADSESQIARAVTYIEEHYPEDPSREEVADYLSLNSSYFSRLFKEKTGRTFSEYVTHVRLKKAVELMREGRSHIYEISRLVGYRDSKYFSRVFKSHMGCKPLEYMRRQSLEQCHD